MVLLYIISCGIMFTHTLAYTLEDGYLQFPYFVKYGIAIMWFFISFFYTIIKHNGKVKKSYFKDIYVYLLPMVLMVMSIILSALANHNFTSEYYSRSFSNIFAFIATILSVYGICNLFGKNTIKYTLYGVCAATLLNIIYTMHLYGFSTVTYVIINTAKNTFFPFDAGSSYIQVGYSLEVADATFAYGFFFLYYFLFADKNKERKKMLILCVIGMYIGFKRIEIVAIFLAIVVYKFYIEKKNVPRKNIQMLFTTFLLLFAYGYLYIMKYQSQILVFLDISRVNMYHYLKELYEISPLYIGKGYGYVNKWLEDVSSKYWIMSVSHSDFVRMYIELGAGGFILWICYYTFYLPSYFYKKASKKAGNLVLSFVIVIMITYLIDNTATLFATQFSFILIPVATNLYEKRIIERGTEIG